MSAKVKRVKTPCVHSRCVQVKVRSLCKQAISVFSCKGKNGEIPLVIIPSPRSALSIMMQIPSGCSCLLQKFGKDIGEGTPGLHFYPAYYRIAYVVTRQSNTYDAPVQNCPTSDNVRVSIDVVLVFHISNAHDFIYRLGAKNFDEFLSGTVDEAIRMEVRKINHKDIYNLRGEKADYMLSLLNNKFGPAGVQFTSVKITSVWLPDKLAYNLEETTKMQKAMDKLRRQNTFEMMEIKLGCDMALEEIKRRSEQVLVSEQGRKKRAELEFEQRAVKAEEDGSVALIEAESKAEVDKMKAEAELKRTKTKLETYRIQELAKAESTANAMRVKADQEEEQAVIEATWKQEEMICEAGATKHDASAEKEASKCLAAKRKHELELREKSIMAGLAERGNFNLIGTSGDKIINAVMTGSLQKL